MRERVIERGRKRGEREEGERRKERRGEKRREERERENTLSCSQFISCWHWVMVPLALRYRYRPDQR